MTINSNFKLFLAVVASSILVAACGGGGGADGTGSTATPAAPSQPVASTMLDTMPSNTYIAGSAKAAIAARLNQYRIAMGVGALKQDSILDTAADAHALYLVTNSIVSHDEFSNFPNYYEATPLSRARKAGAPATEFIGESAGLNQNLSSGDANGASCINMYLNTVYHLAGVTSVQETMGIGFQTNASATNYGCVLDFGATTNVSGTPVANGIYLGGGQQMAITSIAHSPVSNESNVARTMASESPNPAPDRTAPGRPLLVRVNVSTYGDSLTVSSFTLTAPDGSVVPSRIIVPSLAMTGSSGATADVNDALSTGVVVLLPLGRLSASTTYTASFSGQRTGTPISTTWNFTTGAL